MTMENNTNFVELKNISNTQKGICIGNETKKPLLAFKLENKSTKLKTNLQGSVLQAFINPKELLKTSKEGARRLIEKINLNGSLSTEEFYGDCEKLDYSEPLWGGSPENIYKIKVLKSGIIQKTLDLSFKSYHVIGKSFSSDIYISHDSVSHFHAIFQYRKVYGSKHDIGIYIYDLNSENGTFLNGNKINSYTYIFMHGGDIVTFANSPKKYILQTSKDNEEKEAQLTTVELNELKKLEQEAEEKIIFEKLVKEKQELLEREKNSISFDWSIGNNDENSLSIESSESSETEESDNEDLFLADPKKALRDWFKWEGHDFNYQTVDRGSGQYYCYIDLILDIKGTTQRIQANVVGDQMKAIDECALKACRVLNSYGFLKKAQEEKKSISRNWEAVDYYESDEDNFLDRTGIIERKRQRRMQMLGKLNNETKAVDTLEIKHSTIVERISSLEKLLVSENSEQLDAENSNEDALDAFMSKLNKTTLNKSEIRNLKMEINNLYKEKTIVLNSINLAKEITRAGPSHSFKITEKTKNGCRF